MAVVELAIGGAGRGGGDQSRLSMSHRTPRATNSLSPELVITYAMLPLGEAKCVNSTSTGMTVIDVSGAACATFLLGPMGCDWSVAGAEPSDRLSEGLPHPPSAITATTSKTSVAIIRAISHLPHDADGIAIDVLSRSAMGLTPHHGGSRRHPRTLGPAFGDSRKGLGDTLLGRAEPAGDLGLRAATASQRHDQFVALHGAQAI